MSTVLHNFGYLSTWINRDNFIRERRLFDKKFLGDSGLTKIKLKKEPQ